MIGKAVFSETAATIFLTFCMKLGDYKGRKVTEQDFWKKLLIWRYSWKRFQISQKSDTLIFFSKMALTIFLVFSLKLVLNMTSIWMKPIFQKNLQFGDIWPRNRQKFAQIEVFTQRCGTVENESCADVSFWRWQDVATMPLQH